jgi:hypothetical protein
MEGHIRNYNPCPNLTSVDNLTWSVILSPPLSVLGCKVKIRKYSTLLSPLAPILLVLLCSFLIAREGDSWNSTFLFSCPLFIVVYTKSLSLFSINPLYYSTFLILLYPHGVGSEKKSALTTPIPPSYFNPVSYLILSWVLGCDAKIRNLNTLVCPYFYLSLLC